MPKAARLKAAFSPPPFAETERGKYFVSILVETEIPPLPATDKQVGVDLGLKHVAVLSTGEKIEHPQVFAPI
ncbi:hypothetical protein [Geobacillus kaustophilus]|uniref:hypothetical protein n=1 Tax=Geobacillus kaustophilus TaxID=1462 RepID=UPI001F0D4E50|nr:hypothetical protein [Geobacillus kaustophilus]